MEDRFGKLDIPTKQFLDLILIKNFSNTKRDKSNKFLWNKYYFCKFTRFLKESIKSRSRDDDDIINTTLEYLRK